MLPSHLRPSPKLPLPHWLTRLTECTSVNAVLDNLPVLTEHYLDGWTVESAGEWLKLRVGAERIFAEITLANREGGRLAGTGTPFERD